MFVQDQCRCRQNEATIMPALSYKEGMVIAWLVARLDAAEQSSAINVR
jgi:hypothetical protein